ncbi:hypothetical protein GQ457_08G033420 [Hibiscus cannabinus]
MAIGKFGDVESGEIKGLEDLEQPLIVVHDDGENVDDENGSIWMVLLCTFVAVCGSFEFGSCVGYSAPAQSAIRGDLNLSLAEFSMFGSILTIGAMLGAVTSGPIADMIGRKGAMRLSAGFCITGWLAVYFSKGALLLDAGRFSTGYGIGVFSYVVPVFIAEIAPKNLRGGLTTLNQVRELAPNFTVDEGATRVNAEVHLKHILGVVKSDLLPSVGVGCQKPSPGSKTLCKHEEPFRVLEDHRVSNVETMGPKPLIGDQGDPKTSKPHLVRESSYEDVPRKDEATWREWRRQAVLMGGRADSDQALLMGEAVLMGGHLCPIRAEGPWRIQVHERTIIPWRALALTGLVPCIFLFVGLCFIPESPRWLAKVGLNKEFHVALQKLRGKDADVTHEAEEIQMYIQTLESLPETRLLDLFQPKYIRSVMIGVALMVFQQFGGINGISFYASETFASAGLSSGKAGTIAYACLQVPITVVGAMLMDKSGRRPLIMVSATGTFLGCFLAGTSFYLKEHNLLPEWVPILAVGGVLIYVASFSIGMGAVPWVIMSEIFPINVKGVAGSLVVLVNWLGAWAVSYTFNFLMSWSSSGTFFIYSGFSFMTILYVAKFVPETKGKTLEEIQACINS